MHWRQLQLASVAGATVQVANDCQVSNDESGQCHGKDSKAEGTTHDWHLEPALSQNKPLAYRDLTFISDAQQSAQRHLRNKLA